MSETPLLDDLHAAREEILKGEVGALLHDIGKLDPRFPKSKSEGSRDGFRHENIENEKVVTDDLIKLFKDVDVSFGTESVKLLDLIQEHHKRNHQKKLISTLSKCDGIDSGDDKGVVRKKQSINDTVIVSAFGRRKSRIDLNCLDNYLGKLDKDLVEIFRQYSDGEIDIVYFRGSVLKKAIEEPFNNALGETRVPANDVTLFDHSFSTASLYKTQLARAVLVGKVEDKEEWRVFGIFWNGTRFISRARKVADALKRQEIVEDIKKGLRSVFEVEYPIGNYIFEDNDSIFFTFPAFDKSEELVRECKEKAVEIIRKESNNDLWPICALSQPRRSPTVIANMMEFFEKKKGIEKESVLLYLQDENNTKSFYPKDHSFIDNPSLNQKIKEDKKYDICPVCRIRAKREKNETCNVCLERRRGRIIEWTKNKGVTETIWMDEAADENNRVALISLEFEIGDWLNGNWLNSLWVQTIQDWIDNADVLKDTGKPEFAFLRKEGIIKNTISELNDATNIINLLKVIAKEPKNKPDQRRNIVLTFFNKDDSPPKNKYLTELIQDIENRSTINGEVQYKLFNYFFNTHPSPARLRRVWRETEDFRKDIQKQVHESINIQKRIIIEVESEPAEWEEFSTGKITGLMELSPDVLPVVYLGDKKFITIVSFGGYEFKKLRGLEAIEKFLNENENKQVTLEKYDRSEGYKVKIKKVVVEDNPYFPTVRILKSPYQFQMLVPATFVPSVLEIVTSLYDDWFSKVQGKLPLKVGVLTANRKFPLYVLLDSASRMLKEHKGFDKVRSMKPYWDVNGQRIDLYYGFYPTDEGISPEKLASIKNNRKFYLNPGHFDFDFLGGTADRGRIFYGNEEKPLRESINYGWIKPRPHYFHKVKDMLKLRDILGQLSKTQVNGIEQALIAKLKRWNNPQESKRHQVFKEFARAVLIDTFTSKKWKKMSLEERGSIEDAIDSGLLLDTIQLFNHVLKVKIGGDER